MRSTLLVLGILTGCHSSPSPPASVPEAVPRASSLLAAVGAHPRAYARLVGVDAQQRGAHGSEMSRLWEALDRSPIGAEVHAWLGRESAQLSKVVADCKLDAVTLERGRVAIGEPLRIAAELDGKIDAREVACLLGAENLAALAKQGLVVRDRPGGIAIEYRADRTGAELARADGAELAARCTGASCIAVVLGPSDRRLWVQGGFDEKATHVELSGPALGRGAAAFVAALDRLRATTPELQALRAQERQGTLGIDIAGHDPLAFVPAALALRTHLLEAFKIPTSSMVPTLQVNDHVFVAKGILLGTPVPGDLLVYRTERSDYLKRYLAGAGQIIAESDAGIAIDGKLLAREVIEPGYHYRDRDEITDRVLDRSGTVVREHLGARSYLTLRMGPPHVTETWTVPAGHVFLVGDNRENSNDSRYLGASPDGAIKGRVLGVWLAYHDGVPDWDRMGVPIE